LAIALPTTLAGLACTKAPDRTEPSDAEAPDVEAPDANVLDAKADQCPPSAADNACHWSDDPLRSCASVGTGIYGTATEGCNASPEYCPSPNYSACIDGTLVATDATGRATSIAIANGFYASALAPGKYTVCTGTDFRWMGCDSFTLAAGQLRRIDVLEWGNLNGIDGQISVPCNTANGNGDCGPGQACMAGSSPGQATCGETATGVPGDPCDDTTTNQYGGCASGLLCMPSSLDGGVASCVTPTSGQGGPCDDGLHACDTSVPVSPGFNSSQPLLHCDGPSRSCVVQGSAGAWCAQSWDCNGYAGFECFDSSGHQPAPGMTGTCGLRKPPGAPCDQSYQCASGGCENQVCDPLLASGYGCEFGAQCQSGVCTKTWQCM
jgi:hypothetical protein